MLSNAQSDWRLRECQEQSGSDLDFGVVCDVFLLGLFQKTEISLAMHRIETALTSQSFRDVFMEIIKSDSSAGDFMKRNCCFQCRFLTTNYFSYFGMITTNKDAFFVLCFFSDDNDCIQHYIMIYIEKTCLSHLRNRIYHRTERQTSLFKLPAL